MIELIVISLIGLAVGITMLMLAYRRSDERLVELERENAELRERMFKSYE